MISIIGARPQFIKAAALCRELSNDERQYPGIEHILVHTGQHYDDNMSNVFFRELEIPNPTYNLGIGSLSHGAQTGQILEAVEEVLVKEKPDWVIVYGDTNSTLAGTLAAVKLHLRVAHIEAGLRSYNRNMPEEINRLISDHISTIRFCPTVTAIDNLHKEGIFEGVELVGDVMFDCALYYSEKAKSIEKEVLDEYRIYPKHYYLATIHRAENTDFPNRLANIIHALNESSSAECPIVLPLHPRTHAKLQSLNVSFSEHVHLLEPVSFLKMVILEKNANIILTDSGGVQKEAYFYKVPCITMRDETEWVELVEAGVNILSGADIENITKSVQYYNNHDIKTRFTDDLYGNGKTSSNILQKLLDLA